MYEGATPSEINALLVRCGATIYVGGFAKDNWIAYLSAQTSKTGTLSDLEKSFFKTKGGTGNTTHDLVDSYLNSKSYTGDFRDKVKQFCNTASSF